MRRLSLVLALASLVGVAPALRADSIPYSNAGTPANPLTYVATATGNVTGYFVTENAGDNSVIRMIDVTSGYISNYLLPNQSTAPGTSASFGSVNAGDVLVFELYNITMGYHLSTDPSGSMDGVTHGYGTAFAGGLIGSNTFPAGTYIGFEDTPWFDYDYNDSQVVFTNVSIAPTPEPGSLLLLGTGILGVAGTLRRKMFAAK